MVGTFRERLLEVSGARLKQVIADTGKTLASGALPNYEQYRYHCGIIKGLEIALEVIDGASDDLQKG